MIHLEPRHLELVKSLLKHYIPNCSVWAFGSRVSGKNLKPFSDLDLAIRCQNSDKNLQIEQLKEAFIESDIPIKIDIVNWNEIDVSFKKIIERQFEEILS